jgi:hypothetical protein
MRDMMRMLRTTRSGVSSTPTLVSGVIPVQPMRCSLTNMVRPSWHRNRPWSFHASRGGARICYLAGFILRRRAEKVPLFDARRRLD